jgi:hypothetical protein
LNVIRIMKPELLLSTYHAFMSIPSKPLFSEKLVTTKNHNRLIISQTVYARAIKDASFSAEAVLVKFESRHFYIACVKPLQTFAIFSNGTFANLCKPFIFYIRKVVLLFLLTSSLIISRHPLLTLHLSSRHPSPSSTFPLHHHPMCLFKHIQINRSR